MKRRWTRWLIRIGLGFFAVLGTVIAVLFIINPEAVALFGLILIQPLVANAQPPPIAQDQLAGASMRNEAEVGRKLTALLRQKFPAGTNESALKSTLLNQGFKPLLPPPADCLPPGQVPPVGRIYTPCPTDDQSKSLRYGWGRFPCGEAITVRWSTGDRQDVTTLEASYDMACL